MAYPRYLKMVDAEEANPGYFFIDPDRYTEEQAKTRYNGIIQAGGKNVKIVRIGHSGYSSFMIMGKPS